MAKSPAAHTPTSRGGGLLNVKNESTGSFSEDKNNKEVVIRRGINREWVRERTNGHLSPALVKLNPLCVGVGRGLEVGHCFNLEPPKRAGSQPGSQMLIS